MTRLGGFGQPGIGSLVQTAEREIFWGGDDSHQRPLLVNGIVDGASRDAGNTPTTVLRPGLLLGTLSGQYIQWDGAATDGTQWLTGVLPTEIRATDFDGNDADRVLAIAVSGPLKASQLLIKGSALVGHAQEYLARRQLVSAGFVLDDDPMGYLGGKGQRVEHKATDYTIVAADNGKKFFATAAATFTLSALKAGLEFEVEQTADANLSVASAEGDNIVTIHDAATDSVAFSTSSQKIGARARVWSAYVNGTLKWLIQIEPGFTATYVS